MIANYLKLWGDQRGSNPRHLESQYDVTLFFRTEKVHVNSGFTDKNTQKSSLIENREKWSKTPFCRCTVTTVSPKKSSKKTAISRGRKCALDRVFI